MTNISYMDGKGRLLGNLVASRDRKVCNLYLNISNTRLEVSKLGTLGVENCVRGVVQELEKL